MAPTATFTTTMGTFKAELYGDKMPITVGNFVDLANSGFYDGIHFHRVIPNFMNQVCLVCDFGFFLLYVIFHVGNKLGKKRAK